MNARLFNNPACSADKCGTTVSWDDYLAVAYPVQASRPTIMALLTCRAG